MLKTTFLDAVDLVRYVPKLLAWITRAIPCFSTGVFSNTGIVLNSRLLPRKNGNFLAADVVVQGIDAFPPIRPGTQFAVCVNTYNDRLSVMLNTDPVIFSWPEQAFSGQNEIADTDVHPHRSIQMTLLLN